MPPRKKAATETAAEPERRSARIRDAPPKPKPIAPAPVPPKKPKKVDPELAEWKPSKKSATKKRKKADVDVEDGAGIADSQDKAEGDEDKPKKKVNIELIHCRAYHSSFIVVVTDTRGRARPSRRNQKFLKGRR